MLPFGNLNSAPDEELFIDGLTNDVITDLSKFSTLFVIAANSTFQYKGKAVNVKDVARDLGVRYVLEGSVQRSDDTLRINAQLIDATTGAHVWAERYDRATKDVFAIQNEITRSIVGVISPVAEARGKLQKQELEQLNGQQQKISKRTIIFFEAWSTWTKAQGRTIYDLVRCLRRQ